MSQKTVEHQFAKLQQAIDAAKSSISSAFEQLENQQSISPIIPIKKLYLESCSVSEYRGSINLSVPKECGERLEKTDGIKSPISSWGNYYYQFAYDSTTDKELFMKVVEAISYMDADTEKANAQAAEANKKTRDTVMKMLDSVGIPKVKYDYKTSRSRNKEWIPCTWTYEISDSFPTCYQKSEEYKKRIINSFNRLYDADQKKRADARRAQEAEENRKKSERELAFMLAKYGLDITCDWSNLLVEIIRKNKYLRLAYYLEMNRGDWTSGYDYAESGLAGFSVENDLDREIYDCINTIVETYEDIDGRHFRDCEWSYSRLYELVSKSDPELFSDYQRVYNKIES